MTVQVVSVIHVMAMRGGSDPIRDPERSVQFYYDTDGRLLACYDPVNGPPDYVISPPAPSFSRGE